MNALSEILAHFKIENKPESVEEISEGLINKSYKIKCKEKYYLLQKINTKVFKNYEGISKNILKLHEHINENNKTLVLQEIIRTKNDESIYQNRDNSVWRVFKFIPGKTINQLGNEKQAKELGRIFGKFHQAFSDLKENEILEVMPGFHNTKRRLNSLKTSIETDSFDRLETCKQESEFLLSIEKQIFDQSEFLLWDELPERLIHQDAKLSNIIFDEKDNAKAIIDLDTLGIGKIAIDIGDIVRSAMNSKIEDENNIKRIDFEMDFFRAFIKAYAFETKSILKVEEVRSLIFGALLICYEQSIRFLDDYLQGDQYFKIEYQQHNLIRSRNQMAYLKILINKRNELETIVNNAYSDY